MAFKMRGSPMQRNFGIGVDSPMKNKPRPRRGKGWKGIKAAILGGSGAYVGSEIGKNIGGSTGQVVGGLLGGVVGLGIGGAFSCTKTSCTGTTGSYR